MLFFVRDRRCVLPGRTCDNLYKRETLSVVTLEWSAVMDTDNIPVRNRKTD